MHPLSSFISGIYKQMIPIKLWKKDKGVSGSCVMRNLSCFLCELPDSHLTSPWDRGSSSPREILIPWVKQQHKVATSADHRWHRLPGAAMAWTLQMTPIGLLAAMRVLTPRQLLQQLLTAHHFFDVGNGQVLHSSNTLPPSCLPEERLSQPCPSVLVV